ncbi:MAG: hypothetical protein H5T93_08010 [Pseudothermotoga sp.]|uniref:hypothetical protein n=1 Tax=Pseudothermotoga sp. TaxID=2033661 RepID=UPI000B0C114E|nr:hypothetical protein [Pseudothermotoga sp.]HBT40457.1 hypothetical protein [Pseudothermotoga sp.]HCO97296.1 hypothetical protein [Pseudothermotoga sp.]
MINERQREVAEKIKIWTLLPIPGASKPCLIGYYAHCSFTPISTIICWIPGGILYWRRRRAKQSAK